MDLEASETGTGESRSIQSETIFRVVCVAGTTAPPILGCRKSVAAEVDMRPEGPMFPTCSRQVPSALSDRRYVLGCTGQRHAESRESNSSIVGRDGPAWAL